ncbi:MAG TPA: TAXI family TRAP transporter solute-binding subunit [Xanthobacteraceae bacterium]|nr:TAXI family TRAP transporter solute-binding subunit [Xanthobacteraceae bacterium]
MKRHHERTDDQADRAPAGSGDRINNNTIAVIAGGLGSTELAVTQDLAGVLDDGDNLRILPVVGASGRNIRDVSVMKGIDLGVTQTYLLERLRASHELGPQLGPSGDKIGYVTKLFNEEMHLLVRADSDVMAISELNGRSVSLGEPGSGTQLVGHDVLSRLGISVREVDLAAPDAIARLKAGEIDAVLLIDGKPVPALAGASGLRMLPIPFARPLRDDFLPAGLTSEDYPGLIEPGREVETLAVGTVLIAVNSGKDRDRTAKIKKFIDAFFPRLAQLQARRAKWRELNLAATLPGWPRLAPAQEWLDQHRDQDEVMQREDFDAFVRARGGTAASADDRERLFRDFVKWREAQAHR